MAAYEALNNQQLYKALGSVNKRINNLESRYGGVIHSESPPTWRAKKQKLITEKQGIRDAVRSRMDAGSWDI
jgi:hypothetical protein